MYKTSNNPSEQVPIPHGLLVICVVLAFCLPGLIGHQPWKPDEGYIFAGIFHMLQSGDWIVPHLAGEPFMEKPPLYHWVAAVTATFASPMLPLHDGARLASAVFAAIALWATAMASRMAWGEGHGRISILVMLGTLGLLNTIPLMLPDLPLMAGFSVAMLGFVAHAFNRKWAFFAIGTGVGIGFLAKGLLAPGVIALSAIALPVFFAQWRDRRYARLLLLALLVALPWLTI
ncbi:MAG: glycosyltransferase family 39 protein [Burkholderiales bacterium]|nr:glycosyltransferase family 39 protein [Burkholderiales bacterium]